MANPEHVALLKSGVKEWNQWRAAAVQQPSLRQALLQKADLRKINLHDVDLRKSQLIGTNLAGANLAKANLAGAILTEANLRSSNLRKTNLRDAVLDRANLAGANISRGDLRWASLVRTMLRQATLIAADLSGADMRGAILKRANLTDADLIQTDLRGADLRGADLSGTNIRAAALSDADFTGSIVNGTVFANVDISQARGVENIRHSGPSSISIDTLYRSEGQIPEVFLRGVGVPDPFIANMGVLLNAMESIQFYSCFISYSSQDQEFAERLHADLQSRGVRCWFGPHNIQGGRKIYEQIDEAIRRYDKLLLVLSPNSVNSEWVNTEISEARKRELRDKQRMLFPVRLVDFETLQDWKCFDTDTGKDSAREIREYFIPDFSRWKDPDSYQKAFERLLSDLKAEAKDRASTTRNRDETR